MGGLHTVQCPNTDRCLITRACSERAQEHALHCVLRVWTDTLVEVFDEETVFEPPLVLDDDSLVTSPFASPVQVEAPTTIYDPPKKRKMLARGSGLLRTDVSAQRLERRLEQLDASMQRLHDQELEQSYFAAMRHFL